MRKLLMCLFAVGVSLAATTPSSHAIPTTCLFRCCSAATHVDDAVHERLGIDDLRRLAADAWLPLTPAARSSVGRSSDAGT